MNRPSFSDGSRRNQEIHSSQRCGELAGELCQAKADLKVGVFSPITQDTKSNVDLPRCRF